MTELSRPPVPQKVDLRDFCFMPLGVVSTCARLGSLPKGDASLSLAARITQGFMRSGSMPTKRKALSRALRFEVFKRDQFTCQYCGRKAPDIVLQADHIHPVAEGGEDTLLNLITSCIDCNQGKGARTLNNQSAVAKQRAQLELLSERREQIDMMLEWHRGLSDLTGHQVEQVAEYFLERGRYLDRFSCNEGALTEIRKWLRKYTLTELLAAVDVAVDHYVELDEKGVSTAESFSKAFNMIPSIARVAKLPKEDQELLYIRGILRKRLSYLPERQCLDLLKEAHHGAGIETSILQQEAREARSWSAFEHRIRSGLMGQNDD